MSRLFIHIIGTNGDLRWFIEGEEASVSISSAQSLSEKSWDNFSGEVIVFVPTSDVYLTQAKLPRLSGAKLLKAIPYAIEDEITDELKNCHFANTNSDSAGFTAIAVTHRDRIDAWLQLIPHGLKQCISLMIPEVLALPWIEGSWTVADFGGLALVRLDVYSGFAIEKENVVNVLAQYIHDNNHRAEQITLISNIPESALEKEMIQQLKLPLLSTLEKDPCEVFLQKNVNKNSAPNLLQGEYQSNYSSYGIPRLQRIFWAMAAGWLILLSAFGFIKLSILSYEAHRLNNELAVIYNEIYPGESSALSSKKRVEVALSAVKKAKQQSVFLRLVSAASPELVNVKGISIQSASFSNDQLEVKLEASDFQLLDKVAANLRAKGFIADQTHEAKSGSVIQSTLVMKERE
jgi:general secretion pathway protein L